MPMELLAAIGLGASELFKYNRENFKFDKDQQLERELLRLEMQVKRFELFREDIRDLVELTVGRMDVYHLVGALFLEFCIVFFCEGRVQGSAPPFLLSLFLLSNACAFVYLLLAVWLSMHASVASHSFGVRLLTRFVRLPIPSPQQLGSLNNRLADFEFQTLEGMLRVPFIMGDQKWNRASAAAAAASAAASASGSAGAAPAGAAAAAAPAAAAPAAAATARRALSPRPAPSLPAAPAAGGDGGGGAGGDGTGERAQGQEAPGPAPDQNLLGGGERPFDEEHLLLRGTALPERHVQLFRRLQAKWQCYDAYCRVCMTLGVNQILQGLTYFSICHTLVENRSPSCGYALLLIFQAAALAIVRLDISGLHRWEVVSIQAVGALSAFLATAAVQTAHRTSQGTIEAHEDYPSSPLMFCLQALWLELLLRVAAPSKDDAALPWRFRAALFMDVFGDAEDPFEAESRPNQLDGGGSGAGSRWELSLLTAERVAAAQDALQIAESALRRWEAVPTASLTEAQGEGLAAARRELVVWRRALEGELAWRAARRGLPHIPGGGWASLGGAGMGQRAVQPWGELSIEARDEDPFLGALTGPLEHDTGYETSQYYFDAEQQSYVWEGPVASRRILTMEELLVLVRGLEASVRLLLGDASAGELGPSGAGGEATPPGSSPRSAGQSPAGAAGTGTFAAAGRLLSFGLSMPALSHQTTPPEVELSTPLVPLEDAPVEEERRPSRGRRRKKQWQNRRAPQVDDRLSQAAVGPYERHFVPERLPWQVLRGVTRVVQLCWLFTGGMAVLREVGLYRIDFQQSGGGEALFDSPAVSSASATAAPATPTMAPPTTAQPVPPTATVPAAVPTAAVPLVLAALPTAPPPTAAPTAVRATAPAEGDAAEGDAALGSTTTTTSRSSGRRRRRRRTAGTGTGAGGAEARPDRVPKLRFEQVNVSWPPGWGLQEILRMECNDARAPSSVLIWPPSWQTLTPLRLAKSGLGRSGPQSVRPLEDLWQDMPWDPATVFTVMSGGPWRYMRFDGASPRTMKLVQNLSDTNPRSNAKCVVAWPQYSSVSTSGSLQWRWSAAVPFDCAELKRLFALEPPDPTPNYRAVELGCYLGTAYVTGRRLDMWPLICARVVEYHRGYGALEDKRIYPMTMAPSYSEHWGNLVEDNSYLFITLEDHGPAGEARAKDRWAQFVPGQKFYRSLQNDQAKRGVQPVFGPNDDGIAAFYLEPTSGRLWTLGTDGSLQAWDLRVQQYVGRWEPHFGSQGAADDAGVFATAFCELASDDGSPPQLLLAGRSSRGPVVYRAVLPTLP